MARIRTIKPEFFRHEGLQDLEIANPGKYPMMVFEALWGHCDSKGRFEWKPRTLKLDILPFLPFDMTVTLEILESAGMIHRYTVDSKEYGYIDTFEKHQRLTGKEATEGEKFPAPISESTGKHWGNIGEIPESQEGKGREKEGKGEEAAASTPPGREAKANPVVFSTFLAACKAASEKPIPEKDAVFDFAEQTGIPEDFLLLAWREFGTRYRDSAKRYRDWRQVFRNAVRGNWFKLWYVDDAGQVCLTSQGRLLQQAHREAA